MLIWVASALAGLGVHKLRVKERSEARQLGTFLINALLIWLLVWKLSQWVLDPSTLSGGVLALLYFHGGARGAWLAGMASAVYLFYIGKKRSISNGMILDSVLIFLLSGYLARVLLLFLWGEGSRISLGLLAILGAWILFIWLYRKTPPSGFPAVQLILTFLIGHALVSTIGNHLWERARNAAASSTIGLKIGQQAPDFELTDRSGRVIRLSDLRDKTVVLNFWATWCTPCRAEMPEMEKFYDGYRDRDVTILAVNATNSEASSKTVERWLQDKSFTFPIVFDAAGEAARMYRIYAYPSTYIIGPGGLILEKHQGPMNEAMLREAIGK